LTGQKAMITGAAGGTGRQLSLAQAEMGADVASVDIDQENLHKVAEEVRLSRKVMSFRTDVTKAKGIENTVSKVLHVWGRIDILINCAGIPHLMSQVVEDMTTFKFTARISGLKQNR